MKNCIEFTNVEGVITTTLFVNGDTIMARKVMTVDNEDWFKSGKRHRDGDLPAMLRYKNGQLTGEIWLKNGKMHRDDDKPAWIMYKGGQPVLKEWWTDGQRHRLGGPHHIGYIDGVVSNEQWFENGKRHRIGRPAWTRHTGEQTWYEDGVKIEESVVTLRSKLAAIEADLAKIAP